MDVGGKEVSKRKIKTVIRRLPEVSEKCPDTKSTRRKVLNPLLLGKGIGKDVLNERACPNGMSPKRVVPMEVDESTPARKKKKEQHKVDPNQQLISDMWKFKKGNE